MGVTGGRIAGAREGNVGQGGFLGPDTPGPMPRREEDVRRGWGGMWAHSQTPSPSWSAVPGEGGFGAGGAQGGGGGGWHKALGINGRFR